MYLSVVNDVFSFFHTGRCPTSAFTLLTARVHVDVCICVCVTMEESYMEAITGSEGPQTPTVPLTMAQTECISLPLFSFCLSFPVFFLLLLSFCTSFSFLFSLTGLNYFHMSPNKRAR